MKPAHYSIPELTDEQLASLTSEASYFLHDWVRGAMRRQLAEEQTRKASLGMLESLIETVTGARISQASAAAAVTRSEKALRRSR